MFFLFQFLTCLSLAYNSIGQEGLVIVAPALQRFTNLVALDISSNNINLTNPNTASLFTITLQSLTSLKRLDLSNNRTKNMLHSVLAGIQPLEYLRLCGCVVSESDLAFLKSSQHAQSLQSLDLSENSFSGNAVLFELLRSLSSEQLSVLELENCRLRDDEISSVFQHCKNLRALRLLNITRNDNLPLDAIEDNIPKIVELQSLEVLYMPLPQECYEGEDEIENVQMDDFKFKVSVGLRAILRTVCEGKQRPVITLRLKDTKFEM